MFLIKKSLLASFAILLTLTLSTNIAHAQAVMELEDSLEQLNAEDPEKQFEALSNIQSRGRNVNGKALSKVRDLTKSENLEMRVRAITTLGSMKDKARIMTPELLEMLDDDNADVRKAAADSLAKVGGKKARKIAKKFAKKEEKRQAAEQLKAKQRQWGLEYRESQKRQRATAQREALKR